MVGGERNRPEQAQKLAEQMIGHKLITKQTGAGGRPCNAVSSLLWIFLCYSFLLGDALAR